MSRKGPHMRTAALIGICVCLLGLSACAGGSDPASVAASGTLTGRVLMYGGPANATTGKQALSGVPEPNVTVTVQSGSGSITRTTTDAAGRFTFHVTPGTYTLQNCGEQVHVEVRAGRSISEDCVMPVP
jgi:hypothetical protein